MAWSVPVFPSVNAGFNACAFGFLFLGWLAIKKDRRSVHIGLMLCALFCSAAFLVSYAVYHLSVRGFTRYPGQGISRLMYLAILISHTILAIAIVPFVILAVYRSLKGNYEGHKRITVRLLPVWMYVSLTGVVVYLMLYVLI